ncbi:MAG: hypothetical protein D6743_12775 [Calditrichaeota bacterium]|nr:MAG: hypothetical protein D6743_12775 [Calditrichota bacterium]
MDSNITLIGSIIIGGLFLLGVVTFYGDLTDYSNRQMFELLTQENTASLMEIIDHDFRRIGSGTISPARAILNNSTITFLGDVDHDGNVDLVRYFTSDSTAASATPNPRDVILYRQVNGVNTIDTPAGVTDFTVELLDETGNPTADVRDVRSLRVTLTVESAYEYNGQYAKAVWQKRYTPLGLHKITSTAF